jgi:hypothetical protein
MSLDERKLRYRSGGRLWAIWAITVLLDQALLNSGYIAYIGLRANALVSLCGGSKDTQSKDIPKAHRFWEYYKKDL